MTTSKFTPEERRALAYWMNIEKELMVAEAERQEFKEKVSQAALFEFPSLRAASTGTISIDGESGAENDDRVRIITSEVAEGLRVAIYTDGLAMAETLAKRIAVLMGRNGHLSHTFTFDGDGGALFVLPDTPELREEIALGLVLRILR